MIFDKDRIAKLSGLMVENKKHGTDPKLGSFANAENIGDPFTDVEVSTADHDLHEGEEEEEEGIVHEAKPSDEADDEAQVRNMIRKELRMAREEMKAEKAEQEEEGRVREAIRREIRSVLRSRGVTLGGTGWGFKR